MTMPNIFDDADAELDAEFAKRTGPRSGVSDREPSIGTGPETPGAKLNARGAGAKGLGEWAKSIPSAVAGMGQRFRQGLTGGFEDEWLNAMIPGAGDAMEARVQRDTPALMRGAGELAGGVAQGVALASAAPAALVGKVAQGRAIVDPLARAAIGGGVGGAIAGAGNTEGGAAERGMGALLGGGMGAAAGTALAGGAGLLRGVRNAINPSPARVAAEGERVFSDLVRRSGKPVEELQGELAALRDRGLDARAVDVMGRSTQRNIPMLAGKSKAGAEAIQETLENRQRDMAPRLIDRFLKAAKLGERPDAPALAQEIVERRSAQAAPAYAQAFEEGATVKNPEVTRILGQDDWRKAAAEGRALRQRMHPDKPPLPDLYDAEGNVLPEVDLEALHWAKTGMDDALTSTSDKMNRGRASRRAIGNELRTVMGAAKEASPAYKAAAEEFAGESELLDALELGKGFLGKTPAAVEREVADLSPGARETYMAKALEEMTQRIGRNAELGDPSRAFSTPDMQAKLRVLFGDQADEVIRSVDEVKRLGSTYRATQGSRTQPLQSEEQRFAEGLGGFGLDAARGNWAAAVARPVGNLFGRMSRGATGEVADDVLGRLMSDDLTLQRALQDLTSPRKGLARSAAVGNLVGGVFQ